MKTVSDNIWLNALPTRLTQAIDITGLKVDPCTNGFCAKQSSFSVHPSENKGIHFVVEGGGKIPYTPDTLHAIDGIFGRMLRITDREQKVQILIVEHLLSAIRLLGLSDIEIHIGASCRAPLVSRDVPVIWYNKPTYFIPVCGPGVSGYVEQLLPACAFTGESQDPYIVQSKSSFSMAEPIQSKYRGCIREVIIEPADQGSIHVHSHYQPDIENNPQAQPFIISDQDDVWNHLSARPMMRLTSRTAAIIIWILNFRSFALTSETYFKSRPQLSPKEVVGRMQSQYQKDQNEHLVHAAIADLSGELWAFIGNRRFLWRIILKDANHVFRMLALRKFFWENERG